MLKSEQPRCYASEDEFVATSRPAPRRLSAIVESLQRLFNLQKVHGT